MRGGAYFFLLILAVNATAAVAGESNDPLSVAAEREAVAAVLAVYEAGDEPALRALAAREVPNPWCVADRLCGRGEKPVAIAFARAVPGGSGDRLAHYVSTWQGKSGDPGADAVLEASKRGEWSKVMQLTESEDGARSPLLAARVLAARGYALRQLGRLPPSVSCLERAASMGREIGWFSAAIKTLQDAAQTALRGGNEGLSADLEKRRLSLARQHGSPSAIARALAALGDIYRIGRYFQEAATCLDEALALVRETGLRQVETEVLGALANLRFDLGAYDEARALQEQAVALTRELGLSYRRAVLLGNLGNTYHRLGDHQRAAANHGEALDLLRAAGDRAGVARTFRNLGLLRVEQGHYDDALSLLEQGLEIVTELGHHPLHASLLQDLSGVHRTLGDLDRALELNGKERAVRESMNDQAGVLRTYVDAGSICYDAEKLSRARRYQERGLALASAPGMARWRASLLADLGTSLQGLGEYAEAARVQLEAQAIYRRLGFERGIAITLVNLGTLHTEQGRFADALAAQEEALRMAEPRGPSSLLAHLLMNTGNTHASLGNAAKALALQERARATFVRLGNRLGEARALVNIANSHFDLQQDEEALAVGKRALEIAEALGQREMQAVLRGNMANSHRRLGREGEALAQMQGALELFRELGDRERVAWALGNVGLYHRDAGEHEKALVCLTEAAELAEALGLAPTVTQILLTEAFTHLNKGAAAEAARVARRVTGMLFELFGGLADEQGATARASFHLVFEVGVRAGLALQDAAQVSFFLEAGRAGSLLEALENRQSIREATVPASLRREEADARVAEATAAAAFEVARRSGRRREVRARTRELDAARLELAAIVERIQRKTRRAAGVLRPEPASLAGMQSVLAPRDVLVLYAILGEQSVALVVTRTHARIVELSHPGELQSALAAFTPSDRDASLAAPIERLRALLIDPLELPADASRLLVSPDGSLGYVPFVLLAPGYEIAYVPSGTAYGVLASERDREGKGVLALGDPSYDTGASSDVGDLLRGGWKLYSLPETREEVNALGDVKLLGPEATETRLREMLTKRDHWRALHFACHGLVDNERPSFSSLAITRAGQDDGFVTALEVFGMEIRADLVVLSACETGRGKVVKSEGIIGLTRAFMVAGPPRVLVSLWKVDDEATQALMIKFYELWNPKDGNGIGAAAALRQAQEFIRSHEKWEHPFYWAAWVLWGLPD